MKITFPPALTMALCLYSATAGALPWDKPTDAEVAALPPYCIAKFRGVNSAQWESTLGSIYLHVHHYCGAQVYASRYYKSRSPQDRKFFLQEINSNLHYMTTHGEQSSPLMPEIYYTKGRFLALNGKAGEAVSAYLQAIQLKPDYDDPYAAMADFYAGIGKKQDALRILQDGLRQAPTSRSLTRRYQELGGKLPLPEAPPLENKEAKRNSQTPVPAEVESKAVEAAPPVSPSATTPDQASTGETAPKKIGSPSNPWCRFCPDNEPEPAGK